MDALKNRVEIVWGLLSTLRQTVSLWDILDILIIAYLIYRVLTVMRKTSAGSVIKGIALVLAVVFVSTQMELQVVSFFLNQIALNGIIILIVLFQPELRKLFEQMGSRNLSFLFRKRVKLENIESDINNVVIAGEAMAKAKTGALIVFEREIGLSDYAASGTRIDAAISSELIQNIFYHNSPLHDGALIIRDGRLLAASCMLPLTSNANLSRDLGMRHRAGIGISERSDAVAVIVSEQSGSISVAIDGMLKRHLARDTFEKLLRNELILNDNAKNAKDKPGKLKVKK